MNFTDKNNEKLTIYLGYSIMSLKKLGYSEKNIKEFLKEINNMIQFKSETEAIDTINKFLDEAKRQVVFEGIKIPIEYNMMKIIELFDEFGFMGKDNNYMGKKICRALYKENIIYMKDLYEKTKEDITHIHVIGDISYKFFIYALQQISAQK